VINDIKNRDLSYKDTFNTGFEIYKANFKALAILTVMVYIPLLLVDRLVIYESTRDILAILGVERLEMNMSLMAMADPAVLNITAETVPALIRIYAIVLGAHVVLASVITPLISSGSTFLLLGTMEGEEPTADNMLNAVVSNIFKTAVTSFFAMMLVGVGFLLFVLPGLYLMVALSFAVPAVIVTGKWGLGALKESAAIVKGRWFYTLFFLFLSGLFRSLFVFLSSFISSAIFAVVPNNVFTDGVFTILLAIPVTYFTVVSSLWFVNKRYIQRY